MLPGGTQPWPISDPDIPTTYCQSPTDLNAVVTGDIVQLSWVSPHDNDGFYVYYWTQTGIPVLQTVFGDNVQLQLDPNTFYNWSVRTMCNRLTDTGSRTVIGIPFTTGAIGQACPVIDASGASIIKSGNTIRLQWTAVAGITKYIVETRETDTVLTWPSFETPYNFINLSQLVPNTSYEWRVRPDCTVSAFSQWASFTTPAGSTCPVPEVYAITNSNSAVLYWKEGSDSNYKVYMNGTLVANDYPVNIISIPFLTASTMYTAIIIAICPGGFLSDMAILQIETADEDIPDPTLLTVSLTTPSSALIQWLPAPNISSQHIEINGSSYELAANVSSFTVSNLAPYSMLSVVVKSVKDGRYSKGAGMEMLIPAYCPSVTGLSIVSFNHNTVRVAWQMMSGVSYYTLGYKLLSDSVWIETTTIDTNVLFSALQPNTAYVFRVISNCLSGSSAAVTVGQTTAVLPTCPVMLLLPADNISDTRFDIGFTAPDGSPAPFGTYKLVIAPVIDFNDTTEFLGNLSPIIATGLTVGTAYTAKIVTLCDGAPSDSSTIVVNTHGACTPPLNLTGVLSSANTILTISWDAVSGSIGYKVSYKSRVSELWIDFDQQVGTTKVINPVVPGIFDIKVAAVLVVSPKAGVFVNRECVSQIISTPPKVLNLLNESNGKYGRFTWDKIEGVTFYEVQFVTAIDTYSIIIQGVDNIVPNGIDTLLEENSNYSVTVRAYNSIVYGAASDPVTFNSGLFPYELSDGCVAPELKAYSQDSHTNDPTVAIGTKMDISVEVFNYTNNLKYLVEIVPKSGYVPIVTALYPSLDPTYIGKSLFTKLPFGEYTAKVSTFIGDRLDCDNCKDVYSSIITPVTNLTSNTITSTAFTVCWNKAVNSQGYLVYLDNELITTTMGLCYTFTGLTASKAYLVQIRNKGGDCLFSDETTLTVTTTA